jgi:rare lipoprotein A
MTRDSTSKLERRRVRIRCVAFCFAVAAALAAPGVATAGDNGGQAAPSPSAAPPPQLRPVARPSGPANPAFLLDAPTSSFASGKVRVSGVVRHGAGRVVRLQSRTLDGAWSAAGSAHAAHDGSFAITWTPKAAGAYELRAAARMRRHARISGIRSISIFKAQTATWYGPGFYGKTTACGIVLGETTLGVAHRSLPCGTPVFISYGGRGMVVPVIDRGPYSGNAQWDLTGATAQAIGVTQTSRIGVIVGTPTW